MSEERAKAPIIAGRMDEIEGIVGCLWRIADDGKVESVGVVVFELEACMMLIAAVAMACQRPLYLYLLFKNMLTQHHPILARNVGSPSVDVHHVVCAIPGD